MKSKERILSSLERKGYDRLPVHHVAVPQINTMLAQHLGVSMEDLPKALGDDLRWVTPIYRGPELRHFEDGTWEGLWGERYSGRHNSDGVFQDPVYLPYAGLAQVSELDTLRDPSADWYDYSTIRQQCESLRDYAVVINDAGTLDFLNGIGRCRGQEQVLLDVAAEDALFLELVERRFRFFYEVTERTLQAADGLVDIVWSGEDLERVMDLSTG